MTRDEAFSLAAPQLRRIKSFADFEYLQDWFNYYWARGTVFCEPGGVCVVKLFRVLGDYFNNYVHDPCQIFVSVEAVACEKGTTLYPLYLQFVERWGPQKIVMWDRGPHKTTQCPRMYTWLAYEKLVRRMR